MSATQRPRGKAVTSNGRALSFNIDPLTHSRIVFTVYLIRQALGVPASLSTVVRAAVAHYLDHLGTIAQRLASERESKLERRSMRERYRVLSANRGGDAPWAAIPEEAMRTTPMPTWAELVVAHRESSVPLRSPHRCSPTTGIPNDKDETQ
jgi:hypothetical protein